MIVMIPCQSEYRSLDLLLIGWFFIQCFCFTAYAASDSLVVLDSVPTARSEYQHIIQGGENFKRICLSCHSLNHFVYDDVAKTLDLTKAKMPTWPEDSWMGHPPPDLSLITLSMSPEWLYTYLRTFYVDVARPTGFNNLVFPNTNMPNPFVDLQGKQVLIDPDFALSHLANKKEYWYRIIKLKHSGQLSAAEFDAYVADIVAFLTYVSDPSVHKRHQLGPWVCGYLLVFAVVTLLYFRLVRKLYVQPPSS